MKADCHDIMRTTLLLKPTALTIAACLALAACNTDAGEDVPTPPTETATPDPDAPISIIRPDVEQPEQATATIEPLEQSVGFPDGGAELDDASLATLRDVLSSQQVTDGGRITLRAHSDAGGSDAANMRASTARGEAVKDWLVENGIAEDRIDVIAFGEQNPVEPNALPNGEPNEAGRSANRRVDIEVSVNEPDAPPIMDSDEQASD